MTRLFAWIGVIAAVGQVLDWAFHFSRYGWWSPSIMALAALGLPVAIWSTWPRPIEESYSTPNTRICVVKGDIFDFGTEHVVIPTCDTFDTAPPHIIARTSLQAQALSRIYDNDLAKLDEDLDAALADTVPVGTIAKAGKTSRYEMGTVATINHTHRKLYFLAVTVMDTNNNAQGTPDGLWISLNRLWAEIGRSSNGRAICMPVIGGGMSRMSSIVPTQDSLRFTILSFMFASRRQRVCEELRIVLRPEDYDKLDRLELQAFLTSLKPS
ncbi:macro domain-containing protein [Mycobacteroides abscessus]|uniref:macro domain-containing protein n=1 Tax=Mycobacteroides abscessus TaxID=36809 RepID=UPI001052942C|nr:macro domain-containing protein [Mycobacteroides abscessus]